MAQPGGKDGTTAAGSDACSWTVRRDGQRSCSPIAAAAHQAFGEQGREGSLTEVVRRARAGIATGRFLVGTLIRPVPCRPATQARDHGFTDVLTGTIRHDGSCEARRERTLARSGSRLRPPRRQKGCQPTLCAGSFDDVEGRRQGAQGIWQRRPADLAARGSPTASGLRCRAVQPLPSAPTPSRVHLALHRLHH